MEPSLFQAPLALFGRRSWLLKESGYLPGKSSIPVGPGKWGKKDKNGERQLGRGNGWGPVLSFGQAGAQAFPMRPVKVTGEECQWVLRTEKVLGKV